MLNSSKSSIFFALLIFAFISLFIYSLYFHSQYHEIHFEPDLTSRHDKVNGKFITCVTSDEQGNDSLSVKVLNSTSQSFLKFGSDLCRHPEEWRSSSNQCLPCPTSKIVTVREGGRLANAIWEYAAVWAVSKSTNLEPYIPQCTAKRLQILFENLPLPTFDQIASCQTFQEDYFEGGYDEWKNKYKDQTNAKSFILKKYSSEKSLVVTFLSDLRRDFVYRKDLVEKSQKFLQSINKFSETTFVGVHVRRTDYLKYIKKYGVIPADEKFYLKAIENFTEKYENITFVVASDEPQWCKETFKHVKNIYFTDSENSAELDLVILSSCNHSIIDYGTYGSWAALYAGGDTIYYNTRGTKYVETRKIAAVLPYWIGI